ncbi:hypothetical protein RN001_001240 [Aquatica leii]|uniref:Uncharacterized protein n=1 Tax=Aquatica leii TaxID=1421715 RepID=A0AAN7SL40_9COLE|nr:hypothetical protein RN001_001240 [Aquatica leii]
MKHVLCFCWKKSNSDKSENVIVNTNIEINTSDAISVESVSNAPDLILRRDESYPQKVSRTRTISSSSNVSVKTFHSARSFVSSDTDDFYSICSDSSVKPNDSNYS